MIVGLTIFFFAASLVQLYYLDTRIEKLPAPDYVRYGLAPDTARVAQPSPELRLLASLDLTLMERRYHQANVFLMGRLWISYLGFVTGMILALVGAVFILGKLREDTTEASGKAPGGIEAALRTSSPGIVLAALGVVLMIATIVTNHPIHTADSAVFLGSRGKPQLGGPPLVDSSQSGEKPSAKTP
jgi:hypothetical protein